MPTTVSESHMERITLKPVNDSLSELPSFAETLTAIKSLKDGKAAGPDGIPAELIKCTVLTRDHSSSLGRW